jgi:hypothetical protein
MIRLGLEKYRDRIKNKNYYREDRNIEIELIVVDREW